VLKSIQSNSAIRDASIYQSTFPCALVPHGGSGVFSFSHLSSIPLDILLIECTRIIQKYYEVNKCLEDLGSRGLNQIILIIGTKIAIDNDNAWDLWYRQ